MAIDNIQIQPCTIEELTDKHMTLTVNHDLLTHLLFSVVGRRKGQSPTQATMNPFMPNDAQRKAITRAISKDRVSKLFFVVQDILANRMTRNYSYNVQSDMDDQDPTYEFFMQDLFDLALQRATLYEELESDTIHYYTSIGHGYVKNILIGFKCGFTYDQKSAPMYVLIDYLDSILGDVSDSSKNGEYEFSGVKYTDNLLNYVVVLAEYLHFSNGGALDEVVDSSFISKWVPEISECGALLSTRYKYIKGLYEVFAPSFQKEHASVSFNPEYQQKKANLGPKELDIGNAVNDVDKISPTSLRRHLGINVSSNYDETHGMLFLIIKLLETIDIFQRYAINNSLSVNEIVDEFRALPNMQQEFRNDLIAYSRQCQ